MLEEMGLGEWEKRINRARERLLETQRRGRQGRPHRPEESRDDVEVFRNQVEEDPVEYVAQRVLDFSTQVFCETGGEGFVLRVAHAEYRIHALAPDLDIVEAVHGAMTRVAAPGSKLVNVSSGGKMKDTWVLAY